MAPPSLSRRGPGTRTGSTSGVSVEGLTEFRRDLRALDNSSRWLRELAAEQRVIANTVAGRSRFAASAMGGPQKHFASAIKGRGSSTGARIQIDSNRYPGADGAFWGAKQYRQFDDWVGSSWSAGVKGEGPYAINDTIADMADEIVEMYGAGIERVALAASSYWTATF